MITRLRFQASEDFSVGRVTVRSQNGTTRDWVATPGNRTLELDDAEPGFYSAELEPVGQRACSFVFEVKPGEANEVTAPLFSALSAGGDAVAFSGIDNPRLAMEALQGGRKSLPMTAEAPLSTRSMEWMSRPGAESSAKILTIGLSQDEDMTRIGGWQPLSEGEPAVRLEDNGLNVVIDQPAEARGRHPRIRLSLALQDVRVERLMVPLFLGGTVVSFRPSRLTNIDVAIQVMPVDAERRALVRALHAGTGADAAAVYADILRGGAIDRFVDGDDTDPWAAIIATLLAIRFPDTFGPKPASWGPWLVEHHGWASDTHIIHARHQLACSPPDDAGRLDAGQAALDALARAHDLGAPYFSYSNQLMGELLGSLAALDAPFGALADRAQAQLATWRENLPLQRVAGVSFSWQMPDPDLRLTSPIVVPYARTAGNLDVRYARVIFRGSVNLTHISLLAPLDAQSPPKLDKRFTAPVEDAAPMQTGEPTRRLPPAPALQRAVLVKDDPNKGRFGGQASRGDFTLGATFLTPERTDWTEILLTVNASREQPPTYSETVEFFLHPTFQPSHLRATFRGHRATITVTAWGGFTVGVWLPERGVELECDLAQLSDAPQIIRDL